MSMHTPNRYRVLYGKMASDDSAGNNGAFKFINSIGEQIFAVSSCGMGWEHVSVSLSTRCPTWEEMCMVKRLFWDDDDCVVQYHPPKSEYVNCHPYCLHLWRQIGKEFQLPPSWMIGPMKS